MRHLFHIQTFGCQMNAHDSDWLARSLEARGFVLAPFEQARLYILNTCSVREKPEQKIYSELGRIARYNKVHGREGITVCVGGCVAQQVGKSLASRFPEVRLIFGTDGIARAPEAISRLMEEPRLRLSLLDFTETYEERESAPDHAAAPAAAFVNIMQGCDNYCSYCIVPFVRGRQKSRAPEAVLAECRSLLERGCREITLLGQNVNSYGQDGGRNAGVTFARLLRMVAALPGLARLRFVTPHPKDIAPEVISAFGELGPLCPRLHLPLQSGADRILAAMNRRYDTAAYLNIVRRLRAVRPDIVLTTDIIVGFPGETEEDFQNTLHLMEEVGFASAFSFVYSDRPGARAILLPGKVDRAAALERLSRLQFRQNQATDRVLANQIGTHSVILLEGPSLRPGVSGISADELSQSRPENIPETGPAPGGNVAENGAASPGGEAWQGRTPHGFTVNVIVAAGSPLGAVVASVAPVATVPPADLATISPAPGIPFSPVAADERLARHVGGALAGKMLPVLIESAARHSLRGRQAGEPW